MATAEAPGRGVGLSLDLPVVEKPQPRGKIFPATPVPQRTLLVRPTSTGSALAGGLDAIVLPSLTDFNGSSLQRRPLQSRGGIGSRGGLNSRGGIGSQGGLASRGGCSSQGGLGSLGSDDLGFGSRSAPSLGWANSRLPTAKELAVERRVAARFVFGGCRPGLTRTKSDASASSEKHQMEDRTATGHNDSDSDSSDDAQNNQWNAFLSEPLAKGDKTLEFFWYDVKDRLIQKHGAIGTALFSLDPKAEGRITFYTFERMMNSVGVMLENRVMRKLFKGMTQNQLHLPIQILEEDLMKRTVAKLTHTMRGFANGRIAINSHIQKFLRFLAEVDTPNHLRTADRFQRKLTVPFCRSLWHALRDARAASTNRVPGVSSSLVDQEIFSEVVTEFQDKKELLGYEGDYLRRIFQHMDIRETKTIPMSDLVVGLVLLCPDIDRRKKLGLVFEVFDTDNDGCLTYHQIMDFLMCISVQRAIVECNPLRTKKGGPALQKELSVQEGQRTYECVLWHLERGVGAAKDAVNYFELWEALQEQPQTLYAIVPSTLKLHTILVIGDQGALGIVHGADGSHQVTRTSVFDQNRVVLTKTGAKFAAAVTRGFRNSLRDRGARRLSDLAESLAPRPPKGSQSHAENVSPSSSPRGTIKPPTGDTERLALQSPAVAAQMWGAEAAHRYHIFQQAKSGRSRADELRSEMKLRRERKQAGSGGQSSAEFVDYDCHVCLKKHQLRPEG